MNEKIEQFAEAFKKLEELGFKEITFHQYENDGELLVEYKDTGFSIQLWEDDGEINIDLSLTVITSNEVTFEHDDIILGYEHHAFMSDFDTVEEAVQDIALKIIECDVPEKYSRIFSIIEGEKNKFSDREWDAFTDIIVTCYR